MNRTGPTTQRAAMTHTTPRNALYPAIDRAVAEVMNRQAPDCPPLYWSLPTGWVSDGAHGMAGTDYTPIASAAAVQAWATRFGLHPVEALIPGTIRYHGEINDLPVQVWAITDHDAFDTACTETAVNHTEPTTTGGR